MMAFFRRHGTEFRLITIVCLAVAVILALGPRACSSLEEQDRLNRQSREDAARRACREGYVPFFSRGPEVYVCVPGYVLERQ